MINLSVWLSTLGIGFFPKAPGTIGTLFALGLYFILPQSLFFLDTFSICGFIFLIVIFFLGVYFSGIAELKLGHDSGSIIIDEVLGFFISVFWIKPNWKVAIIAFIFFRIFDIFKFEPVNRMQRFPKGWGIMLDDVIAGIYANIITRLIIYFL